MKKITITFGLVLCACLSMFSQTAEERAQITANYDVEKIQSYLAELQEQNDLREARVKKAIRDNKFPATKSFDNGSVLHLYDVYDGKPLYKGVDNLQAAFMQGANDLWNGGSLGLNVEGQNMQVGVWDGANTSGDVNSSHESLIGRVSFGQPGIPSSDFNNDSHATHVTGTIISNGTNPASKGMAPQASILFFNFGNDGSEILLQALQGMLVSNHSYGIPSGSVPPSVLGKYTSTVGQQNSALSTLVFDNVTVLAPYYLPVISSGNSRNSGVNPSDQGFDLLVGNKVAKNVMTVGASLGQINYTGPSSVAMWDFTTWGPADDGRVKPDITTKGVNTFSTDYGPGNNSYDIKSGTSMSAPAVSGGLILLQQYYNQLNSQFMLAATLKGLALHTAYEAGANDGPDYRFGWGLMNTEAGAIAIRDNGDSSLIEERSLTNAANYSTSFTVNSSSKLTVSICWTDPVGANNTGPEDDPTPALVNDLDLQIVDSSGTVFYPWKLNPGSFNSPATRNSTNDVDNFEKIEIENPSGNYTIQVSHKGSLTNGPQNYSLVITGADPATFSTNGPDSLDKLTIFPNPANTRFTVSFNNQLSGDSINVNVYDVLGQLVISNKYDNTGVFEQTVDASTLNSGVYLVKVGNGITSSTKKLIIK